MNSGVTANTAWIKLLNDIMTDGSRVVCRGHSIIELLNYSTVIDMNYPLLTVPERKLGYRFQFREASWILSGDNRTLTIKPYSKMIEKFSDDGMYYFGAYGPKVVDQLPYIIKAFKKDIFTRQAVLTIWRERPYTSNDIPCTVSVQFIIRQDKGTYYLNCFDNMRSSDAWLGAPYDWFNFSMLSAVVAVILRKILSIEIELGNLYFNAASEHLYVDGFGYSLKDVDRVISENENGSKPLFEYKPLDIAEIKHPDTLIVHLKNMAQSITPCQWLPYLSEYIEYRQLQNEEY